MNKDTRYETVKEMIEAKKVVEFRQIFKYIPKTVLARDLVKNTGRMTDLINKAEKFSFEELYEISQLVEVNYSVIVDLVAKQFLEGKDKSQ
ncbi:MAG: hypothetical protein QM731_07805 [Chitinophagaceae bacterium]